MKIKRSNTNLHTEMCVHQPLRRNKFQRKRGEVDKEMREREGEERGKGEEREVSHLPLFPHPPLLLIPLSSSSPLSPLLLLPSHLPLLLSSPPHSPLIPSDNS